MPTINDILPKLQKVRVMSSVDAREGFFHCVLDDETSKLTTMDTPFGRYRWLCMPFGTSPSPEVFQAKLTEALAGLPGIACMADGILIFGAGDTDAEATADHNSNLRALLHQCRAKGIRLNRQKLQINRRSMIYCGHLLERDGVRPDPRDNEFVWRSDTHGRAFEAIKQLIKEAPCLGYYDVTKSAVVQCDASPAGLGCVILQDGRPIEYASRALTDTEKQYAQIEKELLAILFALERFDSYVYLKQDVIVETDHKPLLAIHKKSLGAAPKRLQRMLLRLQRYTYELVYRPGTELIIADTSSRAFPVGDMSHHKHGRKGCSFYEELAEIIDQESLNDFRLVASEQTMKMLATEAEKDDVYQ